MRVARRLLVTLVVMAVLTVLAAEPSGRQLVPSVWSPELPSWVPVGHFLDADGTAQWDLLGEQEASRLRSQLERVSDAARRAGPERDASQECLLSFLPVFPDRVDPRPTSTLDDLVEGSSSILLGRVVDRAAGLYRSLLGSLLEIEVERVYRGRLATARFYVFVEDAEILVDGVRICKSGLRPQPAIGAKLLLFYFDDVHAELPGSVVTPIDDELFYELEDATASLPVRMQTTLGTGYSIPFSELVERTEATSSTARATSTRGNHATSSDPRGGAPVEEVGPLLYPGRQAPPRSVP